AGQSRCRWGQDPCDRTQDWRAVVVRAGRHPRQPGRRQLLQLRRHRAAFRPGPAARGGRERRILSIESDGKPILVGDAQPTGGLGPTYSQVARLNVDGSLDTTFGNGGLVTTAIGTTNAADGTSSDFYAVAIQPDGNI